MTIKIFIALAFLTTSIFASAQYKVTGHITDSSGSRIPFAAINLSGDGGIGLQTTSSDSLGAFAFAGVRAGRFMISVNYIGAKVYSKEIFVSKDTAFIVSIQLTANTLKDVVVTTTKPLIERKIDRTVFNIENSIAAKGTDLATAIGLAPMLKVSENGISIIGKSGVSVMINERMLHLGGADLINYLKSLRADDVAKIEVITTPPSRYEAQGNSGMINIVLKKNLSLGWSGSISASYAQKMYAGFGNNANLNYQSARISASLKIRQYNRKGFIEEQNDIIGANYSILSHDPRHTLSTGIGANGSFEYKINKTSAVGFIYDEGSTNYEVHLNNATAYQTNHQTDSVLQTPSYNRNPVTTRTITLYYDQKIGPSGKKLTTDLNYFSNAPTTNIDFQTLSDHSPNTTTVRTFSGIRYRIWSAQSDLTLPYTWATIETGAKFTNFDNNSDVRYYNLLQPGYVIDPSKSNLFDYNEKNMAAYLSFQKEFSKKWSGKAGLRYEYSMIDGFSPTTGLQTRSDYGKLFPTAYLTYKAAPAHTFSLNYSRRINRPNFRATNPFRYYTNPYTYFTGNPLLRPSFTHNIEFAWLYRNFLSITLYTQYLLNGYGSITQINGPYKIVGTENYLTQHSTGLTATASVKFFSWWESSNYLSYSISRSSSSVADFLTENGSSFNFGTNHTFRINKQLTAFVNYSQSLPTKQSNTYRSAQYDISSGARISAFDNKFQFTAAIALGATDENKLFFKDYVQYIYTDYNYRTATFSITYLFGRSKVKGNTKKVDFKETQRAN
jgi:outer membrane receptor protein involved in Fe transport